MVGIERWVEQRHRWTLLLMGQHLAEWRYQENPSHSGTRAGRENNRKAEKYCFPLHTHSCGELPDGVKNQKKGCSCEPCCHEWRISIGELHTVKYMPVIICMLQSMSRHHCTEKIPHSELRGATSSDIFFFSPTIPSGEDSENCHWSNTRLDIQHTWEKCHQLSGLNVPLVLQNLGAFYIEGTTWFILSKSWRYLFAYC